MQVVQLHHEIRQLPRCLEDLSYYSATQKKGMYNR